MEKELKRTKKIAGITLIALVITIVVLIILAGVLINISLGNNGLFNKAKTAKEMYTNAQNYEETEIAKMTNSIDGYVDGNRGTVTLTDEEYAQFKSLIQDKNKNYNYSTEEQVVGTWIDGRLLYQKTINLGSLPNSTTKTINHNISNIDLSTTMCEAMIYYPSSNYATYLPRVHDSDVKNQIFYEINNTSITIYSRNFNASGFTGMITLKYAKTTD